MTEPYRQLEVEYGEWCGNTNTVACASGTAALQLALVSLRLPAQSEVIVPEFTMIACARAVTMAGLRPVFVDCTDELLMDTTLLESKLSKQTRAIMPVHIYGRRCAMDTIHDFATAHKLYVIEDLAEAHGMPFHPKSIASCWSFYRNKIIAGEEGGMVAFKQSQRAGLAKRLRSLGFTHRHDFYHLPNGFNARMSNSHASLILRSLHQYEHNIAARRQVCDWYDEFVPLEYRMPPRSVPWVYDIQLPPSILNQVVQRLNGLGIAARHGFKPMSAQSEYRQSGYRRLRAYYWGTRIAYLPIWPNLGMEQVKATSEQLIVAINDTRADRPTV